MAETSKPVWVSPFPQLPSGIGQYSADLLAATAGLWDVATLPERGSGRPPGDHQTTTYRHARSADRLILQLGNSQYHQFAFALAELGGSILVMHDVVLHHARLADFVGRGRGRQYIDLMRRVYGDEGETHARNVLRGAGIDVERFPLSEDLIRRASRVVVHSQHARQRVEQLAPDAHVSVIPMGVPLPALVDKHAARSHFGFRDDVFLLTSITHVNPMKRIPVVLRAFRRLLERVPQARFVIAGTVSESVQLRRQVAFLGLQDYVLLTGYLTDSEARLMARAADVSVNLRYPSTGETSASLLRLMGAGVPVIVTKHGSAMELPEGSALHLPVDRLEEETLAEYLIWLAEDPEARAAIGAAGRKFIEASHSMGAAVDAYRQVIREVWAVDLPGLPEPLVGEPAPHVAARGPATNAVVSNSPLLDDIAGSLHDLGLGSHDDTIESVAGSLSDLGIDIESEASGMSDAQARQIDPELLEILACPVCKTKVRWDGERLHCDTCGREYRVENGIPVMLVDDESKK